MPEHFPIEPERYELFEEPRYIFTPKLACDRGHERAGQRAARLLDGQQFQPHQPLAFGPSGNQQLFKRGDAQKGKAARRFTIADERDGNRVGLWRQQAAADARSFMGDAKVIVADVKSGKGTLGVLLYDEATANSIKVTAKNLRELSEKINSGQGTLGKLLTDDGLYKDAQSTLKKADRMIDGLSDQGPITAVGVAAQSLF